MAPKPSVAKMDRHKRRRQARTEMSKADICNVEPITEEDLQKMRARLAAGTYYWENLEDEADDRWTLTDAAKGAK